MKNDTVFVARHSSTTTMQTGPAVLARGSTYFGIYAYSLPSLCIAATHMQHVEKAQHS
jgi:hypothetical protein